eukprot:g11283.t1
MEVDTSLESCDKSRKRKQVASNAPKITQKEKRRAQNRKAAQMSRERKKTYVSELEQTVTRLTSEKEILQNEIDQIRRRSGQATISNEAAELRAQVQRLLAENQRLRQFSEQGMDYQLNDVRSRPNHNTQILFSPPPSPRQSPSTPTSPLSETSDDSSLSDSSLTSSCPSSPMSVPSAPKSRVSLPSDSDTLCLGEEEDKCVGITHESAVFVPQQSEVPIHESLSSQEIQYLRLMVMILIWSFLNLPSLSNPMSTFRPLLHSHNSLLAWKDPSLTPFCLLNLGHGARRTRTCSTIFGNLIPAFRTLAISNEHHEDLCVS